MLKLLNIIIIIIRRHSNANKSVYNYVLKILPNNLLKIIIFISNYTNMQYKNNVSSVDV